MNGTMRGIRVAIAPWNDIAAEAVLTEAGFDIVSAEEDYEALLWLDRHPGNVEHYIRSTPGLRIVHAAETGKEKWDGLLEHYRQLKFFFAGDAYSKEVAEHGLALIMTLVKSLDVAAVRRTWGRVHGQEIHGRNVLVAGFGGIGQHMATVLTAMGARCYAMSSQRLHTPDSEVISLPSRHTDRLRTVTGVETWDIIANCLPLTPSTQHFFTLERFRQLAQDSIFINVGRGATVDQDALCTAMGEGLIRAAGLDVTDPEPLPEDHPLWRHERVLISSHSGNPVSTRSHRLAKVAVRNFLSYPRRSAPDGIETLDPYPKATTKSS